MYIEATTVLEQNWTCVAHTADEVKVLIKGFEGELDDADRPEG